MDAPLATPDLVRPWRTATLVASLVAAVELVLLIAAGVLLLAKPLAHMMKRHAETAAFAPVKKHVAAAPVHHVRVKAPAAKLSRSHTGVLVLNGNGRAGAASTEAAKLQGLGYVIRAKGNAKTVVMYRKGYAGEGARLARDLHVKIVGPLDGLAPSALHGGQLAVVLGAD